MSSRKRPVDEKDEGQGVEKKAKIDNDAAEKERFTKFYAGLNDKTKAIVTKHLKMSGQLQLLDRIREQLIDEFHHKKMVRRTGKKAFRCENKAVEAKYARLFLGRKALHSFQPFPCSFKHDLENTMYDGVKANCGMPFDLFDRRNHLLMVYYGDRSKHIPAEHMYEDFDEKHWRLSDGKDLVSADITLLNEFGAQFLAFYDTSIAVIEAVGRKPTQIKRDRKLVTKYYAW